MIAPSLKLAALTIFVRATASDPNTETIGDYFERPAATKQQYSDCAAGLLRENHPNLSGAHMHVCLDDIAGLPENRRMLLKAAVVLCANQRR